MNFAPLRRLAELELIERPKWWNFNTVLQVLGAVFGLLGQWFVNQQNPVGFVLWLGSNASLLWLQLRMRLYVLVGLHAVYFTLCVHGFLSWVRQ